MHVDYTRNIRKSVIRVICVKKRLVKDRGYMSIYITKLVKLGLVKSRIVNVYVYADINRKKLLFFDTRSISRKKTRVREQFLIRLFQAKKAPLLYRTNVLVCIEDVSRYTRAM